MDFHQCLKFSLCFMSNWESLRRRNIEQWDRITSDKSMDQILEIVDSFKTADVDEETAKSDISGMVQAWKIVYIPVKDLVIQKTQLQLLYDDIPLGLRPVPL